MSISYLPDLAARIKACAQDAVISLKSPIGVVDYPQTYGDTPFFALRLGAHNELQGDNPANTAEWFGDRRTMTLYLVMAKLGSGYKGEMVNKVYEYEELLLQYFATRNGKDLISTTYPTRPDYLPTVGASITGGTGLIAVEMGGTGDKFLASSYTIVAPCVTLLY